MSVPPPTPLLNLRLGLTLLLAGGLVLGSVIAWSLVNTPARPAEVENVGGQEGQVARSTLSNGAGVFPGDVAQDFKLETLAGEVASLSEHRGHCVLLNFFASWCQACRDEMPGVQAQAEKHAAHDWVVLGVDIMETRETAAAFRDELGLTFPILLDETGWVTATYQVKGTPTNLFIDRQGMIVDRRTGYMSEAEIAEIIAGLMQTT